MQTPVYSLLSH